MALKNDPGFIASGAVHGAALVFLMLHFSVAPKFDDAQESIAVETISTSDLNQIMNGEKTAKQLPVPQRRVDKVAAVADAKPLPPLAEAKKDVPQAAPEKPRDDPGDADKPEPVPPARVAALPPAKPEPVPEPPARPVEAVATPPQRPTPEPPKADIATTVNKPPPEDAEALEPKPVPRPKTEPKKEPKKEAKAEPVPVPKPVVRPPDKKPPIKETKAPEPPKKAEPRFKPDELAKLLADPKPAAKPKAGNEAKEPPTRVFNPASISALLDHDAPQRKASTGQKLTQVASLGAPSAHGATLSPSMLGQLSEFFQGQYLSCWTYFGLASSDGYVPVVHLQLTPDGVLVGRPTLINQPADPNQRSLADSALRAVQKCSPMQVPERFAPYFDKWREQVIKFDRKALL